MELLYLLCTEVSESDESFSGSGCPVSHSLLEVKVYIQTHLSDKLTIAFLCKQFSLSPTFLKEGFRRAYGMPIHSFLVQQRLRRAQELICTTRMPIQQIAQAVGYPLSTGRNFEEIKRIILALQKADADACATPADWRPGDDVIVPTAGSCGVAKERMDNQSENQYCLDWFMCFRKESK